MNYFLNGSLRRSEPVFLVLALYSGCGYRNAATGFYYGWMCKIGTRGIITPASALNRLVSY